MNDSTVADKVEEAMNPETFDVLAYLDDQPVARETITIYVDVAKSRQLHKLMDDRKAEVEERKRATKQGKASNLSLVDDDDDSSYDEEINSLVQDLEKSALKFELKTVAPKLVSAIEKHYTATAPKEGGDEAKEKHTRRANAEILSKAIDKVTLGDGRVDPTEWTGDRVLDIEERLYSEQGSRLIGALFDMVNTGYVFDESISTDF